MDNFTPEPMSSTENNDIQDQSNLLIESNQTNINYQTNKSPKYKFNIIDVIILTLIVFFTKAYYLIPAIFAFKFGAKGVDSKVIFYGVRFAEVFAVIIFALFALKILVIK